MRFKDAWSPNFNDRKAPIDMLVLHYTGMETGEAALARMRDSAAEVSAHYMVAEDGVVFRLVPEVKRAWHAGVSSWQGRSDLNSRSIGIEIVNGGHDWPASHGGLPAYPAIQISAVMSLCQAILERHAIPQSGIVGHSDIAPDRKRDPGEHFPWAALAAAGIGLWPDAPHPDLVMGAGFGRRDTGDAVRRLQAALLEIGYGIEASGVYDAVTEFCVTAFQRRWAQDRVTGQADWMTLAKIDAVRRLVCSQI
ncbi:MAG: N-acetylmuramoyl-L-alanine amidase [Pseudomonadota bacterium]